jgi:hypothetical protein
MNVEQLTIALENAITQKDVWTAELMRLNAELSKAKIGQRASLRKAIKNAEQQIQDYNRNIKKLNDDIARVQKASVKNEDNVILANQGISPGAKIAESLGKTIENIAPVVAGSLANKRSASADVPAQTESKSMFTGNNLYYIIGAGVLLFIMMKKK